MYLNSTGRVSSANPMRMSTFDKEDKGVSRNDVRRTLSFKQKRISNGEVSQIPRPRFRSYSSDRASGRVSYLKGKNSLCVLTTPVTPVRVSIKSHLTSSTTANKHVKLSTRRTPSAERMNSANFKGARKDTRPLTDKAYQMMLLNKIDAFFLDNEASAMLNSSGSLKPISLKIFVEASSFLFKFFQIKQELTVSNYVEELPHCAKKLHYPGVMTKSWLKTANVVHSWPSVIGWIGWLVEACHVQIIASSIYELETLPFMGTELEAENSKMELMAFFESYKEWNEENLDREAELLQTYLNDIVIQQGVTEDDVFQAQKELGEETLKSQTIEEDTKKVNEEVERLQAVLFSMRAEETKQLSNIEKKEQDIEKISAELKQMNADYKMLNEQIQIGNMQHQELISVVKDQPMSKVEKENIEKKCIERQNYIHDFREHLKDYKKELYTLDIKLASGSNNLNKSVLTYNKEIFMYINDYDLVNFEELTLPEKGLLNPQIINVWEEKFSLMKTFEEALTKQCNNTISLIRSDTMKLENLQEKIKSLPDDKKLQDERFDIDKMKAEVKKEKAKLTEQIDMLRNQIKELQNTMPRTQTIDLEIEEAKDKFNAVTRRKVFLEQSAKTFFEEFYQIIGKHRNELYDLLIKNGK